MKKKLRQHSRTFDITSTEAKIALRTKFIEMHETIGKLKECEISRDLIAYVKWDCSIWLIGQW